MTSLLRFFRKLQRLFGRDRFRDELTEEMAFHRAAAEKRFAAEGMDPEAARIAAKLQFGNVTRLQEQNHEAVSFRFETVMLDLRFALRQLSRNPGFACTAILILALGICASVSIFAFVDAALVQPLPYQNPSRLVALFESTPSGPRFHLSYLDYLDWKRLNTAFSELEAYDDNRFLLKTPTGVQVTEGAVVGAGFFRTLGIAPIVGRDFRAGEDESGAARTVLLSYDSWQKRFGGRRDVVGQTVTLENQPNTIIGVLPANFHFAPIGSAEFWTPLHNSKSEDRGEHGLSAIARLKDGTTLQAATAELQLIAGQLAKQYPDADEGRGATVISLSDFIVGNVRPIMLVLMSGTALLLLIAWVNVASLLLVRAEVRKRELALRGALGASRFRLGRQFVTEAFMLVALGSGLGFGSAWMAMRVLTQLIPPRMMEAMPYLKGLGWNLHQLIFVSVASLAAGVLFSVVPMLRLSARNPQGDLSEGNRNAAGTLWRRLGGNLVVIELATAMVLLVGAGLLAKSFYRLLHTDIGIQPEQVATLRVVLPHSSYAKNEQIIAMANQVLEEGAALPGVTSIGVGHSLPIGASGGNTTFVIVGRPTGGALKEVNQRQVSSGYFTTLQARLLRGRFFGATEDSSKPLVTIINKAMASQYFPGEDPIGKRIAYGASEPPIEIVGIVDDIKEGPLDQATHPAMYTPFSQGPDDSFFFLIRSSQSEQSVIASMAALIQKIDPGIAISEQQSMTERVSESPAAYLHRSSAWLVGGFAALALILGSVGLYGVLAYSVSQRTREIGVRMALGAQRSSIYQLVLKEAGWLTAAGILAGLVCSIAAAMLMRSLLFGVESWDLPTLAGVAAVLTVSTFLASYIPAHRAASVNPVEALRAE
jgi:macrolide transport system ATP-binding/permease protein